MNTRLLRSAVLLAAAFPGFAFANVYVPPKGQTVVVPQGVPGQVPPLKATSEKKTPKSTVSQNLPPENTPVGTDGAATPKKLSSAQIWEKAIATPPQGKISMRSKKAMEKALIAAYESGKTQNLPPIAGTNGEVLYAYGQSLPTLVTAPMHTSLIALRAGMKPDKEIGLSPAYWQVQALMAGNQPELAVTPRFKGLHANLVVTGTSPHGKPMNYIIEVTSDSSRYTPIIGFYYPDAVVRTWKQQATAQAAFTHKVSQETVAVLPSINPSNLDFDWKIHCAGGGWFSNSDCGSIKPERVFDDGKQTFIQFKPGQGSHGGIPSILAKNSAGQNAIVNTQFRDGYYIVDGVPPKILLIAGKGSSGKVVKLIHKEG